MHLRAIAERNGVEIVDLWALDSLNDPRAWSVDRLHFNSMGHQIVAARIADLLGHPIGPASCGPTWPTPYVPLRPLRRRETRRWAVRFLVPWLGRRLMGRSTGTGASPKRPRMTELAPVVRDAEEHQLD